MTKIVAGDVVRLASGGPKMTVDSLTTDTCAKCIWFDNDEHLHRDYFEVAALVAVSDET